MKKSLNKRFLLPARRKYFQQKYSRADARKSAEERISRLLSNSGIGEAALKAIRQAEELHALRYGYIVRPGSDLFAILSGLKIFLAVLASFYLGLLTNLWLVDSVWLFFATLPYPILSLYLSLGKQQHYAKTRFPFVDGYYANQTLGNNLIKVILCISLAPPLSIAPAILISEPMGFLLPLRIILYLYAVCLTLSSVTGMLPVLSVILDKTACRLWGRRGSQRLGANAQIMIIHELLSSLQLVSAMEKRFAHLSLRRALDKRFEAIACCFEKNLRNELIMSDKTSAEHIANRLKRIANSFRDLKVWAAIPEPHSYANLQARLLSCLELIALGYLDLLPVSDEVGTKLRRMEGLVVLGFAVLLGGLISASIALVWARFSAANGQAISVDKFSEAFKPIFLAITGLILSESARRYLPQIGSGTPGK